VAGRSSKKNQDNFEKIKREIAVKKQKAKVQHDPEIPKDDTVNADMTPMASENCTVQARDIIVVFRVGEEEFAFRISSIKEIIRVPSMTKVPNAPQYIVGLCSLRGDLLPVIDSRKLFGMDDKEFNESSRIIVAEIGRKKAGLLADKVTEVISIEQEAIKEPPASIRRVDGALDGILILNNGKRVVMLLNAEKIIKVGNYDAVAAQQRTSVENITDAESKEDEEEQIVIFNIGMAEYGFAINDVKEIIRLPEVRKVPNTASHIEGVFSLRNQLMAAVSPGKLLGIDCKQADEYSRVIIINNSSFSYGVIVDKVSHVVRVRKELFNESLRIGNGLSTEYIKGVFSLNSGKRLVIMLEPGKLASLEDLKGISDVEHKKTVNDESAHAVGADFNLEHVVVFKLGEEEYGIKINNVQEINKMREITHYPGAPAFIAGMVDLRGEIIPILSLRRLFNLNDSDSHSESRYIVVEHGNKRIGILIDSVSEVLKFPKSYLEEAPEVFKGNDQGGYLDKIAKLNDGKRIVLMLKLSALLSFM